MALFSKKTKTSSKISSPSAASSGNYKSPDGMIESQNNALVPNISMATLPASGSQYNAPIGPKKIIGPTKPTVAIKTPAKTGTSSTSSTSSAYSNPMTMPGATSSASGEPTIGQGLFNISGEADPYQEQLDYYKSERDRAINPDDIFQEKLRMYQGQMDSIRDIYAAKLAETRQQGIGRFGSARAAQARGGLLGSDFAGAQNDTVQNFNNQEEDLVRAEEASRIAEIMGMARSEASAEIASRREAQRQGAESYTNWLAKSQERKQTGLSNLAKAIVASGITDITKLGEDNIKEIASKYGTSTDAVRAAVAEQMPVASDKDRYVTLSAGGGAGGSSSVSPQASAFADQILKGTAQWSNVPAALKGQVAIAVNERSAERLSPVLNNLKQAKALVDSLLIDSAGNAIIDGSESNPVGLKGATGTLRLGAAIGGTNASDFRAKIDRINSLLFLNAVPQMKGMGALTEREGAKLESSASTLNNYKQKEDTYKKELIRLQKQLIDSYSALGGDDVATPNTTIASQEDDALLSQFGL